MSTLCFLETLFAVLFSKKNTLITNYYYMVIDGVIKALQTPLVNINTTNTYLFFCGTFCIVIEQY